MPKYDEIGTRMKNYYEAIPKTKLMRRCPVVIRLDGKSFHSFTKHFEKPFDDVLIQSMQDTMKYLCKNIQGCVLGYHQSDEISLLLIDYKTLNSEAYFDYEVQKLCSVISSMATLAFNKAFKNNVCTFEKIIDNAFDTGSEEDLELNKLYGKYITAYEKGAMFDCRVFNIPKEEVTNYFYWRQIDCIRNSINMVGQVNFSNKELQNKSCNMINSMLLEKGIDWNGFDTYLKRGDCCVKKETGWTIDLNIPEFIGEGRDYIDSLVLLGN